MRSRLFYSSPVYYGGFAPVITLSNINDMGLNKQQAYAWGRDAEALAVEHLVREGYTVREQRWRPGAGHAEIDIIAELPGVIVFVEVKARTPYEGQPREEWSADPTSPAESIDLPKCRRISRAANTYLRMMPYDCDYRFDIITVLGYPDDYILTHIPDAFISPVSTR